MLDRSRARLKTRSTLCRIAEQLHEKGLVLTVLRAAYIVPPGHTSMKIKTNTRKKILKGPTTVNVRFPSEVEWGDLEEKSGITLSADLKEKIRIVTMMFANASPAIKEKTTVRDVQEKIDLWERRTIHLRKYIWEAPAKTYPEKPTLKDVSEQYYKLRQSIALKSPLALLAGAIDAALLTSKYVIGHVTHSSFSGTREQDLWMIWVALVVSLLMENKIRVTRDTKRRQELRPEFIDFMTKLQRTLPEEVQNRSTRASLIKGLNETERRLGKTNSDTLYEMLVIWGMLSLPDFFPSKHSNKSQQFSWAIAKANLRRRNPRVEGEVRRNTTKKTPPA